MRYGQTKTGIFLARPNRFIAHVEIDGETRICHVKNTGRCRELLVRGARVVVACSDNSTRKTAYDLIAVSKGDQLINMDSQAPNRVIGEWIGQGRCFFNVTYVKPEYSYGTSRLDFYVEADGRRILAEVKGVTLERDGVAMFPDAPTERGIKHVRELIEAKKKGYDAYIFFVIQMERCRYFTPNRATHPAFADVLREAQGEGVKVVAVTCRVTEQSLTVFQPVDVVL